MHRTRIVFILAALVGCVAPATPEASSAPALGSADGLDSADRHCQVVLRDLGQPFGLPSHRAEGVDWVVFEGHIDVAADRASDSTVGVVYSNGPGWFGVFATETDGAPDGFVRYEFTLDRYTVPMGDSSSWARMRIEVAPFVRTADGNRLFDHNRNSNDFENYLLTASQTDIANDDMSCQGSTPQGDLADNQCRVVLRDLEQPFGLPSHRVGGVDWVVFQGHLDVAADLAGTAGALYHSGSDAEWHEVVATRADGAPAGFVRYAFTLDRFTVPMGDNSSWSAMHIEVAPFVQTGAARFFDHNRNADPFANYTLTASESHIDDAPVCR